MTEYEFATLTIREHTLWVAMAQVAATLAIGLGQIAVVWFGIRTMRIAGDRRAFELDQRHAESMRAMGERHAESMRSLDNIAADAAAQRRALDNLLADAATQRRAFDNLLADSATQRRALETLITRTSSSG